MQSVTKNTRFPRLKSQAIVDKTYRNCKVTHNADPLLVDSLPLKRKCDHDHQLWESWSTFRGFKSNKVIVGGVRNRCK